MSDYYLSAAIQHLKLMYGVLLNANSMTLPQQIFLLKNKLNCPELNDLWENYQQYHQPDWIADVEC